MAVQPGTPAQDAGFQKGDVLVRVSQGQDSAPVTIMADFQNFVHDHAGSPVQVTIARNGSQQTLSVTPRQAPPQGQGSVGIELERLATIIEKYPWYTAPFHGAWFTGEVTVKSLQGIYQVVANVFSGQGVPQGAELAGPVGITIFLANAASYGAGFFLYFIGSISVLVAIFNLFPIPALDGGKLVFLVIEKIMKKPVPVKWEQGITVICFFLLITISLFITVRFDIPRVIDFWKAGL
jgi:regulator of sigma E protease